MIARENTSSRKQIRKWKKQRAERGFSDFDIFEIDTWFLTIMPEMLEELIKVNNAVPTSIGEEYYKEHSLNPLTVSDEEKEKIWSICFERWTNILKEMRHAFIEANRDTCSYKNKYDEEYHKLWNEFFEVYGHQGEKLKGNVKTEYIKDEDGKVIETYYSAIKQYRFEDMSEENKRISQLYHSEDKKIDKYREANKKKALEMFVKYFDNLWW